MLHDVDGATRKVPRWEKKIPGKNIAVYLSTTFFWPPRTRHYFSNYLFY